MKKSFFLLFLLFVGLNGFTQDKKTLTATFDGFDGNVYSFMDLEDQVFTFDKIDAAVKKNFDLTTEEFLYELFKVTYISEEDENGDVYNKIVGLEIEATDEDED